MSDQPSERMTADSGPLTAAPTIGIIPASALGVAFFYQLTGNLRRIDGAVCFYGLPGSQSIAALTGQGSLRIGSDRRVITQLGLTGLIHPDLVAAYLSKALPEVLLVATNPDQLLLFISEWVRVLEIAFQDFTLLEAVSQLPKVVLCPNGIYFQRLRQMLVEKLEESSLYGRIPDLWPDAMPQIVGRLIRGVTVQTGMREGNGAAALYFPGLPAPTQLAGGGLQERQRATRVLQQYGGTAFFSSDDQVTATHLEFDKAIVNLTLNLIGLLQAIGPTGEFQPRTVAQILGSENESDIEKLIEAVVHVGRAVKAYPVSSQTSDARQRLQAIAEHLGDHVPSSLQYVAVRLREGSLKAECTPTEAFLLDPLIKYAQAAHLAEVADYLIDLKAQLVRRLTLAAQHQGALSN